MKKTNNLYDKYITYKNLEYCFQKVSNTCKNKKLVNDFLQNKSINLYNIYQSLKNKTYKPDPYKCFIIFEKKERLVMSSSIKDKIVNHFVTNFYLKNILEKTLIDQNVATRENKGTSYAKKLMQSYLSKLDKTKEIYALKLDISKYFYNIDHEILITKLQEKIKDKDIINLIKVIIDETNKPYINKYIRKTNKYYGIDIPYYKYNKGLSIGAVTSQFLAIFYMNEIDHYIKEKLHAKYFII